MGIDGSVVDIGGITGPRLRNALSVRSLGEVVEYLTDLMGIAGIRINTSFCTLSLIFEELKRFLLKISYM